jgi:hypothetical protein
MALLHIFFIVNLGMAFIPAAFVVFVVQEREVHSITLKPLLYNNNNRYSSTPQLPLSNTSTGTL